MRLRSPSHHILLFPLFVARASLLAAQGQPLTGFASFKGTVLSGIDSSPVPYATLLLRADLGRTYETITDTLGGFGIDTIVPGRYSLRVAFIGYPADTDQVELEAGASLNRVIVLRARCKFDSVVASRDIRRGHPRILLHGGIAPAGYGPREMAMERRYGFSYWDFGDQTVNPFLCDQQYNRVVFRFLDGKYGTSWRDSVRTR